MSEDEIRKFFTEAKRYREEQDAIRGEMREQVTYCLKAIQNDIPTAINKIREQGEAHSDALECISKKLEQLQPVSAAVMDMKQAKRLADKYGPGAKKVGIAGVVVGTPTWAWMSGKLDAFLAVFKG